MTDTFGLFCVIPAGLLLISACVVWVMFSHAPQGEEDDGGFHEIGR